MAAIKSPKAATAAEWRVGGQLLAAAQPIQHGDHRAVRIQRLQVEKTQ